MELTPEVLLKAKEERLKLMAELQGKLEDVIQKVVEDQDYYLSSDEVSGVLTSLSIKYLKNS